MKTKPLIFSLFFVFVFLGVLFCSSVSGVKYSGEISDTLQDTWVYSVNPDNDYSGSGGLDFGYNTGFRKTLIEFNVTDILSGSPYVYLRLYGEFEQTSQQGFSYVDWNIYKITESWVEATATWNNQPSYSSLVDVSNVTVRTDLSDGYIYVDITIDWNNLYATDFIDFYGYMLYMVKLNDVSYFSAVSSDAETYPPVIYYSDIELDSWGVPVGAGGGDAEDDDIIGGVSGDFLANWFKYAIFFVVIPLAMVATISNMGDNVSPSLMLTAFMASETLMTAISVQINLVGIWFMLIVIIADIMIIFGLMKGRG